MMLNKLTAILNLNEDESRLDTLTTHRPVASLPFASRYRILDFTLSSISHANVISAALFIGESGRSVYDHIRSGKAWDLDTYRGGIFTFSQINHKKAIYESGGRRGDFYEDHKTFINRAHAEYVFVSGSKVIANVDLLDVLAQLEESNADMIRLYTEINRDFVEYHPDELITEINANGKVIALHPEGYTEITSPKILYDMNMTIVKSDLLIEMINRAEIENLNYDVDQIVERYMFDYDVASYEYKGFIANIDSASSFFRANMKILEPQHFTKLFQGPQSVITKAHQGVPTFYEKGADINNAQIATGCRIGGTVTNSVIHRKVVIEKTATIKNSIIFQNCEIAKGVVLNYVILDKNVEIGPGVQIQGTPDQPVIIEKDSVVTVS